jgi:hypothetical protein
MKIALLVIGWQTDCGSRGGCTGQVFMMVIHRLRME